VLVGQPEAQQLVQRLARASRLDVLGATEERAALPGLEQAVRPGLAVRLLVEVRAGERERIAIELNRLAKRMAKEQKLEAKLEGMLGSQSYLGKAPPHVVAKDREYLQEAQLAIASTAASIALFQRLLQPKGL
jgi:valyl-tRNA synthetase